MSKTVEKMLEHPIATIFITATIFDGIIAIINNIKGSEPKPIFTISITKKKKDKKNKTRK